MANPIAREFNGATRPSGSRYAAAPSPPPGRSSPSGSPMAEKAAENVKGCCKKTCDFLKSEPVMEALVMLVSFSSTIILALAWNTFMRKGAGDLLFDGENKIELWWYWVWAVVCLILAMIVCYVTGETLEFAEGLC